MPVSNHNHKVYPRELIFQRHPQLLSVIKGTDPWDVYDSIKEIGSGTYGHVYKAKQKASGTYAAMKSVRIDPADDLKTILTELYVLKDCHHPNIVEFFGAFLTDSRACSHASLWIAMEYCGGKSLQDIYATTRRPFEEATIAFVMRETLRGLAHMHTKQQIHRDVKGANILLTKSGCVKLADFGISAQISETIGKRMSFIGTPYWMAPEVADVRRKGGYDERCDTWAAGITAIELAELEPPMFSLHPMKALQLLASSRYRPPKLKEKSSWSASFHEFLKTALRLSPKSRPTAQELLGHQFLASQDLGEHLTRALLVQFREDCRRYQGFVGGGGGAGVYAELLGRTSPPVEDVDTSSASAGAVGGGAAPRAVEEAMTPTEDSIRVGWPANGGGGGVGAAMASAQRWSPMVTALALKTTARLEVETEKIQRQASLVLRCSDPIAAQPPHRPLRLGSGLSKIFDDCPLKINAVAKWTSPRNESVLLIGANEGIYSLSLNQRLQAAPAMVLLVRQRCLWLFVYRGVLVSLSGRHPQLYRHDLSLLFPADSRSRLKGRVAMRLANNPPSAKIPRTKGCMRVSARKHPETAERWLACAMPDSVLLLQWDNGRRNFLEYKCLQCPDLPQPLLTFELFVRSGYKLPFVCVGVLQGRNEACVRFRLLDLNRLDGLVELWPADPAGLDEELDLSSVLVCHSNQARLFHPANGRSLGGAVSLSFTIENALSLEDRAVVCFYKHGFQARCFDSELTKTANNDTDLLHSFDDPDHVYRFVGVAGPNPVLERRPVHDPMASCDLLLIVGCGHARADPVA
uniref:Mitogen-activated protein kinase kinase kinase kinase n=1 Tax=Macrostomum lignano TaxID=282301 RepID=A0A1I8FYH0_9PLAT